MRNIKKGEIKVLELVQDNEFKCYHHNRTRGLTIYTIRANYNVLHSIKNGLDIDWILDHKDVRINRVQKIDD